jgi:son of sevenless
MIRFQQPYNLKEIPEVQQYLNFVLDPSRATADGDMLYHRRSVLSKINFNTLLMPL